MDSPDNPADRMHCIRRRLHSEHGLEAIEFALIGAIMTVMIVAGFTVLGDGIYSVFETILNAINSAGTGP